MRDHSESPQGTRDNADGTAPQNVVPKCQGLLPLLTPTPDQLSRADGASPLTRPSLLGPVREGTATPALHPRGEHRNNSPEGRLTQHHPNQGSFPMEIHPSEPNPCSQESPPAPHPLGCTHTSVHGPGTQPWEVAQGFFLKSKRRRTQRAELAEGK